MLKGDEFEFQRLMTTNPEQEQGQARRPGPNPRLERAGIAAKGKRGRGQVRKKVSTRRNVRRIRCEYP